MVKTRNIGKYELHERLGRGSFTTVYRAFDTALQHDVALKVLHPQWADDTVGVSRLRQDMQAMTTQLRHSNIAQIYEIGEGDGEAYIATEYLPGDTLHVWLKEHEQVSVELALPILSQIATALDFAHARDMAHLDINPANVMIETSNTDTHVTLLDFGLRQVLKNCFDVPLEIRQGPQGYLAPEQLDHERTPEVGPATDRYALGVIAYQMFTGRVPFPGNRLVLPSSLGQTPPDPGHFAKELPGDICSAIVQMLDPVPVKRFPTARAFVLQLQKVADRQRRVSALLEQTQFTLDEDKKLELYEDILKLEPQHPEALAGKREIWLQRGDVSRAINSETARNAYEKAGLTERDIAEKLITTEHIRPAVPAKWEPHSILDGKYEILEMVSITARSIIYHAQEVQAPRDEVIIKRLKPDKADDKDAVGRFEREIAVLRRVQHESVLAIYDSKTIAPDYYFVTERSDLGTLQEHLDAQPDRKIEPRQALDIARSIARGLEAIHRDGYVHRDIKPGNIFLFSRSNGSILAKLGDFSISHMPTDQDPYPTSLTTDSWGMATPAYASPEQLRRSETDPRSDLYSWGMVLFEMLTGDSPLTSHPGEFSLEYLKERSVPIDIARLIYKSLRPVKEDRFQSAHDAYQAVEKILNSMGKSFSGARTGKTGRKWAIWGVAALAAIAAGVVLFNGVIPGVFPPDATATWSVTPPASPSATATIKPSATATPEPTEVPDTATATPTSSPTITPSPTLSPTPCLPDATFAGDITIPDGTILQPGETFIKTWSVRSSGCAAWPPGSVLAYASGDRMEGPASVAVPQLAPGEITNISVTMVAPQAPGNYTGNWRLRDGEGTLFGSQLSVKITVVASVPPTATQSGGTDNPPQTANPTTPPRTAKPTEPPATVGPTEPPP